VDALLAGGVVNGGRANALKRKIDQALQLLDRDNTIEAVEVLREFDTQVGDMAQPACFPQHRQTN
jgi:hypothetical protein